MKSFKDFSLLILVLFLFTSAFPQQRSVNFFPLVPVNAENEFCRNYSSLLKEKLIKSEVFTITDVEGFEIIAEDSDETYINIKNAVKEKCKKDNIESAFFGYIRKTGVRYQVYIELYDSENENVISKFRDSFILQDEAEFSTKRCAVQFASRIQNINFAKITFSSAIIPGLGLANLNKKSRAASYFGGIVLLYLWQQNLSSSIKPLIDGRFSWDSSFALDGMNEDGSPRRIEYAEYYINGELTSFDEWNKKRAVWMMDNAKIISQNDKFKNERKYVRLGMAVLYVANLLDTVFQARKYNDPIRLEQKISFDFDPFNRRPGFKVNYHF
ncbi:hypothetical protein ACFL4T_07080 [candidate division KSB1 bacterium]